MPTFRDSLSVPYSRVQEVQEFLILELPLYTEYYPTRTQISSSGGGSLKSRLINEEKNPTRCHLLLYYAYVTLNMFRAPLCPSSGAHGDSVGYHIGRLALELLLVGG